MNTRLMHGLCGERGYLNDFYTVHFLLYSVPSLQNIYPSTVNLLKFSSFIINIEQR